MAYYNELVRRLAEARDNITEYQERLADVKLAIAESELGLVQASYEESLKNAKAWEVEVRAALDQAVLEAFDGNKRPHPAITVKEMTKHEYDPSVAFAWAGTFPWEQTKLQSPIVLDQKLLEKAFAKIGAPEFVKVLTVKQVTVASDLSGYLE